MFSCLCTSVKPFLSDPAAGITCSSQNRTPVWGEHVCFIHVNQKLLLQTFLFFFVRWNVSLALPAVAFQGKVDQVDSDVSATCSAARWHQLSDTCINTCAQKLMLMLPISAGWTWLLLLCSSEYQHEFTSGWRKSLMRRHFVWNHHWESLQTHCRPVTHTHAASMQQGCWTQSFCCCATCFWPQLMLKSFTDGSLAWTNTSPCLSPPP